MRHLSKSKIMAGLQCPKRLHLEVHRPELISFSEQAQRTFAIGDEVGTAARGEHPDGTLVVHRDDLSVALTHTQQLLQASGPITLFEPAFQHGGTLVRAGWADRQRSDAGSAGKHFESTEPAARLLPGRNPGGILPDWQARR